MSVDKKLVNKLIIDIKRGGETAERAVQDLFDMMGHIMYSLARTIVKTDYNAQEVVQNSLIKIVQNSSKFRFYQNGYGWVLTIVRNTAINLYKSEKLRCHSDIDNCPEPYEVPKDTDSKILVQWALGYLNEDERLIIAMKYYEDKTVRQIASELHLPPSTVQSIITRSEKKLKKCIQVAHSNE